MKDETDNWPLCAVCGKKPREGKHATDLGEGHDYVPMERQLCERIHAVARTTHEFLYDLSEMQAICTYYSTEPEPLDFTVYEILPTIDPKQVN